MNMIHEVLFNENKRKICRNTPIQKAFYAFISTEENNLQVF